MKVPLFVKSHEIFINVECAVIVPEMTTPSNVVVLLPPIVVVPSNVTVELDGVNVPLLVQFPPREIFDAPEHVRVAVFVIAPVTSSPALDETPSVIVPPE